jgi:type IX secretion system PorP/SprF family membrane protein
MGRRVFIFIVLVLLSFGEALSQQDPQFSIYTNNILYYNPAYSGIPGMMRFDFIHRSQWLGYTTSYGSGGAPTTQVLTVNAPLLKLRSGVGFHAVNDKLGNRNNMEAQVSYAYHLAVRNAKLSFGIRAGMYSVSINYNEFNPANPDDPILLTGKESQVNPDFAVGVFYRAEKYYAGISSTHLTKAEFNFGNDSARNALENHFYLVGGYDYQLNYDIVLKPSLLVKTDFKTYSFDLSVMATLREKIWGGLSFRQSDAVVFILGYSFLKENAFKVGYAFDYIIKAQEAKQPTSHEFYLSYTLPVLGSGERRVIRTPRFRH